MCPNKGFFSVLKYLLFWLNLRVAQISNMASWLDLSEFEAPTDIWRLYGQPQHTSSSILKAIEENDKARVMDALATSPPQDLSEGFVLCLKNKNEAMANLLLMAIRPSSAHLQMACLVLN